MRLLTVLALVAIAALLVSQLKATAAPTPKAEPRFQLVGFTQSSRAEPDATQASEAVHQPGAEGGVVELPDVAGGKEIIAFG